MASTSNTASTQSEPDLARVLVSPFRIDSDPHPRTLVELKLIALSGAIRDKPHWNQKIKDPEIAAKWRAEATAQDADPAALSHAMAENEHLAGVYPDNMYPAAVPGVFAADDYIPRELRKALMAGVEKLEGEGPPDWHPGSDEQVRDLVHPSLYPLVYGVTNQLAPDAPPLTLSSCLQHIGGYVPVIELPPHHSLPKMRKRDASNNFQWLPAEFEVKEDGEVDILSYINNLHPKAHAPLYPVIASIFQRFVPLFNEVLTAYPTCNDPVIAADCNWYAHDTTRPKREDFKDGHYDYYYPAYKEWVAAREPKLPEVPEYQPPPPAEHVVDLKGRKLQVIVKLSSIHLTTEKPEYPGGNWHLEGMLNEHIIATGIYYYDQQNVTPSNIAYRTAIDDDFEYEQDDRKGVEKVYGIVDEEPGSGNQTLGSVTTLPERCICFPNNYQHRVEPFKLQDPTQPGHRKILVFWLVHPATKVHSTERVPPQQLEWLKQELYVDPKFWPAALPDMPLKLVEEKWMAESGGLFSFEKAKEYRLKLMEERQFYVLRQNEDKFEREIMLCEH